MEQSRFQIVFKKLSESLTDEARAQPPSEQVGFAPETRREVEEIAELRRMVLEITEPEPQVYTTT